jgi:hypothetical protein
MRLAYNQLSHLYLEVHFQERTLVKARFFIIIVSLSGSSNLILEGEDLVFQKKKTRNIETKIIKKRTRNVMLTPLIR